MSDAAEFEKTFSNGDVYKGGLSPTMRRARGQQRTYRFSLARVFKRVAGWANGKPHGYGVYTRPNGTVSHCAQRMLAVDSPIRRLAFGVLCWGALLIDATATLRRRFAASTSTDCATAKANSYRPVRGRARARARS